MADENDSKQSHATLNLGVHKGSKTGRKALETAAEVPEASFVVEKRRGPERGSLWPPLFSGPRILNLSRVT